MKNRSSFKIFTTILSAVACFGLVSRAQAQEGDIGGGNTVEGFHALNNSTVTGGFNTGLGWFAGGFITDGFFNTAAGAGALDLNVHGDSNTAFGTAALALNIGGTGGADRNTGVGTDALFFNAFTATQPARAHDNTAVGAQALFQNLDGGFNTAVGSNALFTNGNTAIGDDNTAVGAAALFGNDGGDLNTAVGFQALRDNVSGSANTAVGTFALTGASASRNTAIGTFAMDLNGTGGRNTAVGAGSLFSNDTGDNNVAVGDDALVNNLIGDGNTAVGLLALEVSNTFNNTAVGIQAANRATGGANTVVGAQAGALDGAGFPGITAGTNNVVVGAFSGRAIAGGTGNVYLGEGVDPGVAESTFIRINDSNPRIAGTATTFIDGIWNRTISNNTPQLVIINSLGQLGVAVASSAQFKKDIESMGKTSEAIFSLRPVTFHYKDDPTNGFQCGLIAEEVAKVNPGLITVDDEGKPASVRHDQINSMLLNEFLKEHKKVEEQQASISQLKSEMQTMVAQLKEQAAQIQKVSAQAEMIKPAPQVVVNKP